MSNELWNSNYEPVIGLEIHAQIDSESKIFCACPARPPEGKTVADLESNENCCEVCAGHPGTLPVLNEKVVEYAVKAGFALNCQIRERSVFSRKHYFYPDLPKGYQISQYDLPICEEGSVEIQVNEVKKTIRVQRIHIEEDAGKNLHLGGFSLVNLNRAGVPLIEIVSHPDIRSPAEAAEYMRVVHGLLTAVGVCRGNMQEGNLRCDANVSVRKKGEPKFGTRAEIKNVNSFRFVESAVLYEIQRQIESLERGQKIIQETRSYDSARGVTESLRSKEEAHDYRYFPEPDLMPLILKKDWVDSIRKSLPELPEQRKSRYIEKLKLSEYDAGVLASRSDFYEFFDSVMAPPEASADGYAKTVANFVCGEIARLSNEASLLVHQSKLTVAEFSRLVELNLTSQISSSAAKAVLQKLWTEGGEAVAWVDQLGLKQVSDQGALSRIVDEVWDAHPTQAKELLEGKEKLLGFLVGQAMKRAQGKANPSILQELFKKKAGTK